MTARLETERLLLRPFTLADAPVVEREVARVEIARMTLTIPHPYPEGGGAEWISRARPGVDFALELRDGGELVGAASLVAEEEHRRAELGYWLAVELWGRGYMTEAAAAVVAYGFRTLTLNRVFAQCFAHNPGSRRVLEKIGMTYEGTRRRHAYRLGAFADIDQFGILRSEWRG